jgi:DNA-binding CsgD family transcriptional regulator
MAASWRAYWLEVLTRAEVGGNRVAEAEAAADAATRVAAESGLTLSNALARRAHAAVALHRSEHERALELARESIELATEAGAVLEAARSKSLVGRTLAAAGDRTAAIVELQAAAEVLERCGAGTYLAEARADLRRLGSVKRKSARGEASSTGLDSLTAREREIADLVWDRQTNKAIAATLFLSEKTIEGHLRNIYAKLRISSRVELGRAIERDRT